MNKKTFFSSLPWQYAFVLISQEDIQTNSDTQSMAYTVSSAFEEFRKNIELSGDHRETATARRNAIVSLLKNDFDIIDAFPTGSIPRYTALTGNADLDVFVVLHYAHHIKNKLPSQVLQAVQNSLSNYRKNVRKNGQAVTLYYETWPNVDVVPVSLLETENPNNKTYNVPDMNDEKWILSRPTVHSENMQQKNLYCGESFKRTVKMIKWWNLQHSEYLQSYHIEVMALKIFDSAMSDYSWDVYKFFAEATGLIANPLFHDGSQVDSYLKPADRYEATKRLTTAREKSLRAWFQTHPPRNNHKEAIALWKEIFRYKFPDYG